MDVTYWLHIQGRYSCQHSKLICVEHRRLDRVRLFADVEEVLHFDTSSLIFRTISFITLLLVRNVCFESFTWYLTFLPVQPIPKYILLHGYLLHAWKTYVAFFHKYSSISWVNAVYAISFLCALNTRKVLRGKGTEQEGNTSTSQMRNTIFLVSNNGRLPSNQNASEPHQNKVSYSIEIKKRFKISEAMHVQSMEIGIRQEVSVITDVESGYGYGRPAVWFVALNFLNWLPDRHGQGYPNF